MKRFCDIYRVALLGAVTLAAFSGIVWGDEFSVAEGKNWSLHVREAKDGAVVMAVPKAKPTAPVKLCDAVSVPTTRVFLSADDDIAIVETGSSSLGLSLSVFLLTEGSEFLELKDWDVTAAVQRAYEKAVKPKKPIVKPSLHFVAWSTDGKAALVRWSGGPESWYAVVDFERKSVGSTLERMNRRSSS